MFYCGECAKKAKWPESYRHSFGPCEICGKNRVCNDVPSSSLPIQETKKRVLKKKAAKK